MLPKTTSPAALALLLDGGVPHAVDVARRAAGVSTNTLEASITLALTQPGALDRTRLEPVPVIDPAPCRLARQNERMAGALARAAA